MDRALPEDPADGAALELLAAEAVGLLAVLVVLATLAVAGGLDAGDTTDASTSGAVKRPARKPPPNRMTAAHANSTLRDQVRGATLSSSRAAWGGRGAGGRTVGTSRRAGSGFGSASGSSILGMMGGGGRGAGGGRTDTTSTSSRSSRAEMGGNSSGSAIVTGIEGILAATASTCSVAPVDDAPWSFVFAGAGVGSTLLCGFASDVLGRALRAATVALGAASG